jgi:hypothetical protein
MDANRKSAGTSYEIVLAGDFGAQYLATFATLGVDRALTTSVFLLPASPGRGIDDVVDTLHARGHAILEVRSVRRPGGCSWPTRP